MIDMDKKLKVAVLGSGNIGTDLLVKVLRSEYFQCNLFIGRNMSSPGMRKANMLGIPISDQSINAIVDNPACCDLVFDATSASSHREHAEILGELGIKAVDMTPSKIGDRCVPAINLQQCLHSPNVNMITCGGQASIPIAHAISQKHPDLEYIEVVSSIASRSAGPGTRANIDEYIENTEQGLRELTGCQDVKAILILNPAEPPINMKTTIFAKVQDPDIEGLLEPVAEMAALIARYVPGYEIVLGPLYENGRIVVTVQVRGRGDYLPSYAGNLDIINCAAIALAEEYAKAKLQAEEEKRLFIG